MGREVPFKKDKVCDECGDMGALDFMGDYFCPECVARFEKEFAEVAATKSPPPTE
jgi:uncharacterized Zn finger protein (UPF0148 family)